MSETDNKRRIEIDNSCPKWAYPFVANFGLEYISATSYYEKALGD